ncbi:MAG: FtsW/RodA/SpoVE family cell cycle protein [Bacteroidaceae bacterium]|nr:FtsW/RodA/SpoVE family cell cycle protein [Bacteroidaceae bacterium]
MKKCYWLVVTVLLALMFVRLLFNYNDRFEEVEACYGTNPVTSVNLASGVQSKDIASVLQVHNYVSQQADAEFVADFIAEQLKKGVSLPALFNLNKRVWQIPASKIDSIAKMNRTSKDESYYVKKWKNSLEQIGVDDDFLKLDVSKLESVVVLNKDLKGEIRVTVNEEKNKSFFAAKKGCEDVVVRLSRQYLDSLNVSQREVLCFAKSNSTGEVVFKGLEPNYSYSVLPIKKGFEYGSSQGTVGGNLAEYTDGDLSAAFSFTQLEHKIRIFDASTLKQIKEDLTMTVRSPKEFVRILSMYVVLFFVAWWGLLIFCRMRKKDINIEIWSILMALTGLCLLTMFSINDPLTDKLLGIDMASGIIAGVVIIAILQNVNFKKLYQNRLNVDFDVPLEILLWVFKPFRQKVSYLTNILSQRSSSFVKKSLALLCVVVCLPFLFFDLIRITALHNAVSRLLCKLPKGGGYILFALFLTMLLFTSLGSEVGGMKVNLNVGIMFQPSEIAKYLIVFFMAAFFCVNANKIVQFSEKGNTNLFGAKIKMLTSVILGLGCLMVIYLKLGDMGPSLVLAFTFILLYSLIKSKIDLQGLSWDKQMQKIFTCDFAMLIYGILSFALFLYVGYSIGNMGIFCILWFAVWIIGGIIKKQIFETAIFFNFIVSAFIFGGAVLGDFAGFDSVAKRLDSRNEMCTNTWGTLPINGNTADAGENTQVVEGLWALASGGMWGQGLGDGSPHLIPAFHTDMILESVGEQSGFVGVFVIILLLAILLRNTVVVGYRTSHPFVFYLCLGIAVVTAIQFVVISLGSTGIIPLTGVTVPFFSYGKVSMILNLTAFGIILSISTYNAADVVKGENETTKLIRQNIGKYNYSVSLLSWAYCVCAIFIASVFYYYQIIAQEDTLIRPVYVDNSNGIPVVEYNPRIEELTKKMYAGDIYDRNGLLLATSDKLKIDEKLDSLYKSILGKDDYKLDLNKRQRRYYPFGDHLSFMLGDYNSNLYTFKDEKSGYVAEWRHLPELKGYNNLIDENGKRMPKVELASDLCKVDKWSSEKTRITSYHQLYNYSALIPYLKAGVNSSRVRDLNKRDESWLAMGKIEPQDIRLTIDAELQARLQIKLQEFVNEQYKSSKWRNKVRASVVILNAEDGDLLASANYPLPNQDTLKNELIEINGQRRLPIYRDAGRPKNWKAYTDMDLGLMQARAPGSTAKIISSLAGLRKLGVDAADPNNKKYSYYVHLSQKVGAEPVGQINMKRAVVESSNCYYINLVNNYELYDDLSYIYRAVGAEIGSIKPYVLHYSDSISADKFYSNIAALNVDKAISKYRKYVANNSKEIMQDAAWQITWGQGALAATPLSMARVASIVANDGTMTTTRYRLDENVQTIEIVDASEAAVLSKLMVEEAATHTAYKITSDKNIIGGKTGTANRHLTDRKGRKLEHSNDSWYICYVKDKAKQKKSLAIAIRIERGQSSVNAKKLVKDGVLPLLMKLNYVN